MLTPHFIRVVRTDERYMRIKVWYLVTFSSPLCFIMLSINFSLACSVYHEQYIPNSHCENTDNKNMQKRIEELTVCSEKDFANINRICLYFVCWLLSPFTTQAITFIFNSLGVKGVPYLAQVIPSLLTVIRTSDANFRDYLFQQLAMLIGIVKQHIRNYLDDIIEVLKVSWSDGLLFLAFTVYEYFIFLSRPAMGLLYLLICFHDKYDPFTFLSSIHIQGSFDALLGLKSSVNLLRTFPVPFLLIFLVDTARFFQ